MIEGRSPRVRELHARERPLRLHHYLCRLGHVSLASLKSLPDLQVVERKHTANSCASSAAASIKNPSGVGLISNHRKDDLNRSENGIAAGAAGAARLTAVQQLDFR